MKKGLIYWMTGLLIIATASAYTSALQTRHDYFVFSKTNGTGIVMIEEEYYNCEFMPEFPYDCIMTV